MSERLLLGSKDRLSTQISRVALSTLGEPVVDYDRLAELFYGDLGVPVHDAITVDLFRGPRKFNGYVNPLRRGFMHVNVATTEANNITTNAVIHEGVHLAQAYKNYPKALGYTTLRCGIGALTQTASAITILEGARNATFVPVVATEAILGFAAAHLYRMCLDPAEREALQAGANPQFLEQYHDVIAFPTMQPHS